MKMATSPPLPDLPHHITICRGWAGGFQISSKPVPANLHLVWGASQNFALGGREEGTRAYQPIWVDMPLEGSKMGVGLNLALVFSKDGLIIRGFKASASWPWWTDWVTHPIRSPLFSPPTTSSPPQLVLAPQNGDRRNFHAKLNRQRCSENSRAWACS